MFVCGKKIKIENVSHSYQWNCFQGVASRPAIYFLASQTQLTGYVKNGSDGAHIYCNEKLATEPRQLPGYI
jgi:hypothetical protein